jgi:uncharacterized membrane protein YqiK
MSEPIAIDPAEIIGPMLQHRDVLLAEAAQAEAIATQKRAEARAKAERILAEADQAAQTHDQAAATKRAYAEHWDGVITREQAAAGVLEAF